MPITRRWTRVCLWGGAGLALLAAVGLGLWASLAHRPRFYRDLLATPRGAAETEAEARHFVAKSLQVRNDIANEPTWEAVFTDTEVNAWLAEDLVNHFADQLPPGVSDPRIALEPGRVTLAFTLEQGSVRSVIWVVAGVRVPEDNVVSFRLEKIRAGALPVPRDRIIRVMTDQAARNGLDLTWTTEDDLPVATLRYQADRRRTDVVLERLQVRDGQLKLSGRSGRETASVPRLPDGETLQRAFPKRNHQLDPAEAPPAPDASAIPPAQPSTGPESR